MERDEQKALVRWLNMHAKLKNLYCKIHNEGKRTALQTHFLKLEGLRPHVSDIFIYCPTKKYAGLWLEVKRNKKYTPSERSTSSWIGQETFQETVKSVGYEAKFCYGFMDGIHIIESYLLT